MGEKKQGLYAWVVYLCCVLTAFVLIGLCTNTRGLYLQPVSDGLGITRATLSIAFLVGSLLGAFVSANIGKLSKRFTMRRTMLTGIGLALIGSLVFSFTSSFFAYFVGEILLGLAMGCSSMTMIPLFIYNWFENCHGTLLGVLYMSTGLGSVVFAPILGRIIEGSGYHKGYLFHAAIVAVLFVFVFLFVFDKPEMKNQKAFRINFLKEKKSAPKKVAAQTVSWTIAEARKTPVFYIMLLLAFSIGFGVNSVQGTYAAYLGNDLGYGTVFAASIVSAIYVANMIVKLPVGIAIDRFSVRVGAVFCTLSMGMSAIMLLFVNGTGTLTPYFFAVFMGMGNIIFTVVCPLIAVRIFGSADAASLTGMFMAFSSVGSAVAAPLSNLMYQASGSYRIVYLLATVMFVVMVPIEVFLIYPKKK